MTQGKGKHQSKNQSNVRQMKRAARAASLPSKQERAVKKSFDDAERMGRRHGRQDALDYLHQKFLDPMVSIQGTEGKAILRLVQELGQHFRDLDAAE